MSQDLQKRVDSYIDHHVIDSYEWHLPFLPTIHLPEFLSLHRVMLLIGAGLMCLIFCGLYRKETRVPRGMTNFLEMIILFIRDQVCRPAFGDKYAEEMTPTFCTMFFFILTLNLMGLVPLFAGATGNVNVTAGLALAVLTFMFVGGIRRNGVGGFLKAFVPAGVPIVFLPLIFVIEFASMFIRAFALTVRLFMNMMAGHVVILSLVGLLALKGMGALPVMGLIVFIYILKILVAFLQAYIFTMFSAIFIGQIYHPEH